MGRTRIQGIAVSPGIVVGKARYVSRRQGVPRRFHIAPHLVDGEVRRFEAAVSKVVQELEEAKNIVAEGQRAHCDILDAHLLICRDPRLFGESIRQIRTQHMNAEWALAQSLEHVAEVFNSSALASLHDRLQDVRQVESALQNALQGKVKEPLQGEESPLLLAHDISPAEVLSLGVVKALVTEEGGSTSHAGLIARNLGIPAVFGVRGLEQQVTEGETVIVDGFAGILIIAPTEDDLMYYERCASDVKLFCDELCTRAGLPATTKDGYFAAVFANIDGSREADTVRQNGGEGVGLVRTECEYVACASLPDEGTLYAEYARLVRAIAPGPVFFRTLDLGSDKGFPGGINGTHERNPVLGLRAVRFSLKHQDIFRRQLRALLRAGVHGNVSLMLPMVSGIEELRRARNLLGECQNELAQENIPFASSMPLGILVELPSVVVMADVFAREADFFSIGTNDLIQFTLGADRNNRHVEYLYQPLQPAVIRSIKYVVDMAHQAGISVAVCGEMATDPYCIPLLLGMQVDVFSVPVQDIPLVKHVVRENTHATCQVLLENALKAATCEEVKGFVDCHIKEQYPEYIPFYYMPVSMDDCAVPRVMYEQT